MHLFFLQFHNYYHRVTESSNVGAAEPPQIQKRFSMEKEKKKIIVLGRVILKVKVSFIIHSSWYLSKHMNGVWC